MGPSILPIGTIRLSIMPSMTFRDPRRDHSHGRVWRITHKDRPLVKKPQLVGLPIQELVDNLKSPEAWTAIRLVRN